MAIGRVLARTVTTAVALAVVAGSGVFLASRTGIIDVPRRYDPLAIPDLDQKPNWLTGFQLKHIDVDPANCAKSLGWTGLNAALSQTRNPGGQCEIERPVTLSRLSQAKVRPESLRCNIAARLYGWERHVVQPAAQRHFGEPVAEIIHVGAYSCRTIAGSSSMSQHANANAFDVAGFRLRSGKMISVLKDWPGRPAEQRFLRDVRDGACGWFNLVLGPDYNAAHRDHFHFDMGWARRCI